ncbi:hypothetical protein ACFYTS_35595 [Nocardia sp. NPDC004151]
MTLTSILAAIAAIVLILHAAAQIPLALAGLLSACKPVLTALRDLRKSDQ